MRLFVLDFKGVCKQLHVHLDERPFLAGETMFGWFVFRSVLFGVESGPCRVVASMRATQALLGADSTRIKCYANDPIVALQRLQPESPCNIPVVDDLGIPSRALPRPIRDLRPLDSRRH